MDESTENLIRRLRDAGALAKLVGDAPSFLKAISDLPAIARGDATVLVTGETGTGKELVAHALHYLSERAAFPLVAVNCGALTDTLLQDELFGHERGAFTDASQRRPGLLAAAEHGTLVLDEVEALSERGQVMLLRVLQDRSFRPVGSTREHQAQVRFVAVSNVPLESRVQRGTFRADLYYRLSVFRMSLPALRERREDILVLAAHFLDKHAPRDRPPPALSPSARAALVAFDWPGNVRELENAIIRAIGTRAAGVLEAEDLALPGPAMAGSGAAVPDAAPHTFRTLKKLMLQAFEREYLVRLLGSHRGNVTHAARAAGTDRRDLGRLLQKHGLDPKRFGAPLADTGG